MVLHKTQFKHHSYFFYICERLKKCFKQIGPKVCRRHNLSFTHQDIRYLIQKLENHDIKNINQRFISNKLSLYSEKRYPFFHKPSQKEDIPLLPKLIKKNNYEIQQTEPIKYLGVLLNENLSCKDHIQRK